MYNVKCEEYFNKKIISIWTNRKISRSVKEGDSLRSEEFVNKDKNLFQFGQIGKSVDLWRRAIV